MTNTTATTPLLGRLAYERLKFVAQILLPAVATLYFTLAGIWGLPNAEQVVGTITAVDLFLGMFLTYDKHRYEASGQGIDGKFIVDREDGIPMKMQAKLDGDKPPELLADQKQVVFKVVDGEDLSV